MISPLRARISLGFIAIRVIRSSNTTHLNCICLSRNRRSTISVATLLNCMAKPGRMRCNL